MIVRSFLALAALVGAAAIAAPAAGQETPAVTAAPPLAERVIVTYLLADPAWVDRDAFARRTHELARVTLSEEASPDAWRLSIEMSSPEGARVTLYRTGAEPIERTVAVPDHAAERTEILAILAANLLRDEAAELLALLGTPPVTAPDPDALAEPEPLAEPTVTEADVATAALPSDPEVALGDPTAPDRQPGPPWLRLGLAAHLTSVPAGGGTEADAFYGLEIAWTAPEYLAIGVRDVSAGGLPEREGAHIDASPFAELAWTTSFFSLYGQLGAQLQAIIEPDAGDPRVGVAPFVDAGARFQLDPVFSLAVETMLRLVATDELVTSIHQLPSLSVPWSAGITALFHVR